MMVLSGMRHLGGVAATLSVWAAAAAQTPSGQSSPPPALPDCNAMAGHNAFDFWVGEWNVYGRRGMYAGKSFVTERTQGCMILEEWVRGRPGEGVSMSFIDPETGRWTQIYRSPGLHSVYVGELNARGQMVMPGVTRLFGPDGAVRMISVRGVWTPLPNGHVIQHFQSQMPDGSWRDGALLTYVPAASDPNGPNPAPGATGPVLESAPAFD